MPLETSDITALADAIKNLQQPAQTPVNATAVKLPSFWQGNPEVWFRQVESVFTTRNPAVTTQETKFEYVIQALDTENSNEGGILLNFSFQPIFDLKLALTKSS